MADNNQNLVQFRLTGTLSVSGTTVNVSNDILRDTAIDVENASITLQNEGGTVFELIKATITGGVLTTSKRGIKRDQTLTEDATLKREWRPGTIGFITSFASDIMDIDGNNTISGDNTFTGTNLFNKSLGVPFFANATARDAAIPTPTDRLICYQNDIEEFLGYKNGSWQTLGSGGGGSAVWYQDSTGDGTITGAINGVNTTYTLSHIPGSVDAFILSYNGQVLERGVSDDYTLVGNTLTMNFAPTSGKLVAIYPDQGVGTQNATTRATTLADSVNGELYRATDDSNSLYYKDNDGDNVKLLDITTNKIPGANIDYTGVDLTSNVSSASETVAGLVERATDAEVITGTDTERYITPKQVKDNYGKLLLTNLSFSKATSYPYIINIPVTKSYTKIKLSLIGGGFRLSEGYFNGTNYVTSYISFSGDSPSLQTSALNSGQSSNISTSSIGDISVTDTNTSNANVSLSATITENTSSNIQLTISGSRGINAISDNIIGILTAE